MRVNCTVNYMGDGWWEAGSLSCSEFDKEGEGLDPSRW